MLYIENLFKNYGRFPAVRGLTLRVPKGDLFGFVGPNGAGKTTTMRIVCGLLRATAGTVTVDGITRGLNNSDVTDLKRRIGYVPDFFGVYDNLKVSEYLEFYGSCNGMFYRDIEEASNRLLDLVKLSDKKDFYVDSLSRGMKQRLCVARALMNEPPLLIMDEPSSGLDPTARVEMKELLMNINSMGKTIMISSHILSDISEMCNSIGVMNMGQLVAAGKLEDILKMGTDMSRLIIQYRGYPEAVMNVISAFPDVRVVYSKENEITLSGVPDDTLSNQIVMALMNQGIIISSFRRDEKNLENLFVNLTGGMSA